MSLGGNILLNGSTSMVFYFAKISQAQPRPEDTGGEEKRGKMLQ